MKTILDFMKDYKLNFFHDKSEYSEYFYIKFDNKNHYSIKFILENFEKELSKIIESEHKKAKLMLFQETYNKFSKLEKGLIELLEFSKIVFDILKDYKDYEITFLYERNDFTEIIKFTLFDDMSNKLESRNNLIDNQLNYLIDDSLDETNKQIVSLKETFVSLFEFQKEKSIIDNYLFNIDLLADNLTGFYLQTTDL